MCEDDVTIHDNFQFLCPDMGMQNSLFDIYIYIYDVLVSASDALFYPLAVESFGPWTPASLDCLRTIATKTITSNNIPFSQAYSNLMQQLSVNLWKFNARMIESRLLLDSDDCFWDLPVMSVSVLL